MRTIKNPPIAAEYGHFAQALLYYFECASLCCIGDAVEAYGALRRKTEEAFNALTPGDDSLQAKFLREHFAVDEMPQAMRFH